MNNLSLIGQLRDTFKEMRALRIGEGDLLTFMKKTEVLIDKIVRQENYSWCDGIIASRIERIEEIGDTKDPEQLKEIAFLREEQGFMGEVKGMVRRKPLIREKRKQRSKSEESKEGT